MSEKNQSTYQRSMVVHYYRQLRQLQAAERAIFSKFQDQLPQMRVLDIGVGGGRTTTYLGSQAFEYIGIDYSAEMVTACQDLFKGQLKSAQFQVCDARDMRQFASQSFDFILFSFNGIDYVSHQDRLKILQEVRRVGKTGGFFFFSSHNLQGLEYALHFKPQLSLNPLRTYSNIVIWGLLRFLNRDLKFNAQTDYVIARDESHNFRLQTYYIRPLAQLRQLQPLFSKVTTYSWQTGDAIAEADLPSQKEMWLYYLCHF